MTRRSRTKKTAPLYSDFVDALPAFRAALAVEQDKHRGVWLPFQQRGAFATALNPLENVHATGIGLREKRGHLVPEEYVLKVFVFHKAKLGTNTPKLLKSFAGLPVDVEELPVQRALSFAGLAPSLTTRVRPIVGGMPVTAQGGNLGTIGCFVRNAQNQIFALGNNHVFADINRLPRGTPVGQPNPSANDVFATLWDFEPIRFPNNGVPVLNHIDAAVAKVSNLALVTAGKINDVSLYRPGIKSAFPGMPVVFSGAVSGAVIDAAVSTVHGGAISVNLGSLQSPLFVQFDNCIHIRRPGPGGGPVAKPGDSGALVLEKSTGIPVGLLFASDLQSTFACDIATVCQRFQVQPI
ncbi:MAG: hypothetical protein JST40_14570 [Armatimonadetes bacterium]|nr:hypothetical protein [Armatimonadota bacterium]